MIPRLVNFLMPDTKLSYCRISKLLSTTLALRRKKGQIKRPPKYDQDGVEIPIEDELEDRPFSEFRREFQALSSSGGHDVYIIQPEYINMASHQKFVEDSSPEHSLAEAVALVDSFEHWRVVGTVTRPIRRLINYNFFFNVTSAGEILGLVEDDVAEVSAVFINRGSLTRTQRTNLEAAWRLPVFDRYSIVLQIFQQRARSKEAKIQVALAEIPYLRSQLREFEAELLQGRGRQQPQKQGRSLMGGAGETSVAVRERLLNERQRKLKKMLSDIKGHRLANRDHRSQRIGLPIVAVVGYTNCGKTSLIKALTDDGHIQPENRLFATLDVTFHECRSPSGFKYLLVDTVGFLSELPTFLIASFRATLEDAMQADVILHLRDASHPQFEAQNTNVLTTLRALGVSEEQMSTGIIEAWNKVDLVTGLDQGADDQKSHVLISATRRIGLSSLNATIEDRIIAAKGLTKVEVKIFLRDQHVMNWLNRDFETTVLATDVVDAETEIITVDTWMTASAKARFVATFPDVVISN